MEEMDTSRLRAMDKDFSYAGTRTNEISFPLGGIGTGCIGLAGNGRLVDWEIFNRPNKNSYNGFSFFAVKAESGGSVKAARVLNGDLNKSFTGSGNEPYRNFGFGVERESMAGFPHFQNACFTGQFPIAQIAFDDPDVPLQVTLTAYNPFIPLNDKDSSIPAAIFNYEVVNLGSEPMDISVVGSIANPFKQGILNEYADFGTYRGMRMTSAAYDADDPAYGELFLSTDGDDVSYQHHWYRGDWFDHLTVFWKDFTAPGGFLDRKYTGDNERPSIFNPHDVSVVGSRRTAAPGERVQFRFVLTWHFPNFMNFWNPGKPQDGQRHPPVWKNYYAMLFEDAASSASYVWRHFDRLYNETLAFKDALFGSTLPDSVIEAVSANLSTLKSPTVLRLPDGSLYGFEGCHPQEGCCEGSCAHVWNYEQATPFLFPALARGMRELDYRTNQEDNGKVYNRMLLPPERTKREIGHPLAAADGQMGGVIRAYREWKIGGDRDWLRKIWPSVKKAVAYAWHPDNEYGWDRDGDGVMEGRQHHTLDSDLYGPNATITGMYLAALLAAAAMAEAVGDPDFAVYRFKYERGRTWVAYHLFNGEYFHQKVDLHDARYPIDPELGELKYQIGEGCHIDQLVGQWHAHIAGLGYLYDPGKVKTALQSVYRNNFVKLGDIPNACRIYALNEEQGLMICTWPHNNSPIVPIPYADECMNGFEYQAACHMIYEGLLDEGLQVVAAVRSRYDGAKRNPWNEFECGSHYVRSLASYSLLLALSGFEYDSNCGHMGFNPRINKEYFRCFWSLNEGWGEFSHRNGELELKVLGGRQQLCSFSSALLRGKKVTGVWVGERASTFVRQGERLKWEEPVVLDQRQSLKVCLQ